MQEAQVENGGAAEEEKELTPEEAQAKLENLYNKLPLIIARIREDNPGEAGAALDRLLSCFRQINALEKKLLPEGQSHQPITLARIYDMAVNGGGNGVSDEKLAELAEANAAFAEENAILADTVENLTFQLGRLRGEKVEEFIKGKDGKPVRPEDLKEVLGNVTPLLTRLEAALEKVAPADAAAAPANGKTLDERMVEGLSGLSDITAEHLMATPDASTKLGKILRRAGFAYDYKDLAAARVLVAATLEANRKLSDAVTVLTPAQEQMERLHEVLVALSVYAGQNVRDSQEYKDALAQIDRLQAKIDRHENPLNDLKQKLESKQAEIELAEAMRAQKAQEAQALEQEKIRLTGQIRVSEARLEELKKTIAQLRNTEAGFSAYEGLEKEVADLKQKAAGLEAALQARTAECASLQGRIGGLTKAANDREKRYEQDMAAANEKHEQELRQIRAGMLETENGLMAEKLRAENHGLREAVADMQDRIEEEKEKANAFVQRVGTWIEDPEDLKSQLKMARAQAAKWQCRAGLKWAFVAVAGVAILSAGYVAGLKKAAFMANKADVAPENPAPPVEQISFQGQFFRDHCADEKKPCTVSWKTENNGFVVTAPTGF